MAGGITKAPAGYFEIEYTGPWGGLQQDKPSTTIDFGACVAVAGMEIRTRLTAQPAVFVPTSLGALRSGGTPAITFPAFAGGEYPLRACSLTGVFYQSVPKLKAIVTYTLIITNQRIWASKNILTGAKEFDAIYTFPANYLAANVQRVSAISIGNSVYISTSDALGIYQVSLNPTSITFTVTEITAQNSSGPFIGCGFLGTIGNRLVGSDIIGGDGNQTGTITGINVTVGGAGYPASGTFTIIGGGGIGAAGTYTTSGGAFNVADPSSSFTFTNNGTGYIPGAGAQVVLIAATGTGFVGTPDVSTAISPSTTTYHPDYYAWSFPNAFGQWDPNNSLTPGGFNQLTEARGFIGGMSFFQSVVFVGHNGGITEVTINTASNIVPFIFNPLWSSDQGIVCRYGSMAQYGDFAAFLGEDNAYTLSPASGLAPFGDKIANIINFIYPNAETAQTSGVYGSLVQIEGEKHYLLQVSSTNFIGANTMTVYDFNFRSQSWYAWMFPYYITMPIYQAYDIQQVVGSGGILPDNWILFGVGVLGDTPAVYELAAGQHLLDVLQEPSPPTAVNLQQFAIQFRTEAPAQARLHTIRRVLVDYENIPLFQGSTQTLPLTLTGQNSPSLTQNTNVTLQNTFSGTIVYPDNTQPAVTKEVLVSQIEPTGPAFTGCNTTLSITSTNFVFFITRIRQICELDKDEVQ